MAAIRKLVIASSNAGKLREFSALLGPLGIEVVPQGQLGVTDADEPHFTFVENAIAKARHASQHTDLPAFADDSGIVVEALGGMPGVHSARFAGEPRSDARNNAKLVQALRGRAQSGDTNRNAHYYCVIVLVRRADDPEPIIAEGRWQGTVIGEPRGQGGFGYDPYFYLPELGLTAAELPPEQKNAISHRAIALRRMLELLQTR